MAEAPPTSHRIGLIVPSSNTTMETELPAMLARRSALTGERFTFHSSRARLQRVTPEELARMVDDGERCAAEVADAGVDVVAYACLVALMAQGPGFHAVAERRLGSAMAAAGCEAPVVTSAGALVDAIGALGARRVAILAPYLRPVTELVLAYIEDAGIEVVDSISLEVADNRAVGRIDPRSLLDHLERLDTSRADAVVLSACVQCPSLPAIPAAEARCGRPVLSAATATAFRVLQELGLDPAVPEAGALLAGRGAAAPA
jgi:maleate isomerase